VAANSPILGTQYHIQDILAVPYTAGNAFGAPGTSPYHHKIDFTKPWAQEYMNSVVALFASWGIDFIKLDGVTPGSDSYDLSIDNRADVAAWSKAIALSGRSIWLTVSWARSGLPERLAAVCKRAPHRPRRGMRRKLRHADGLAADL
jgi:alpha-galactosidase